MTISIKANPDGLSGSLQIGGVDKVIVGNSGIEAGSYNPGSIAQADLALAASSIGVGQTWQNVTGSRVSGVTYYNLTGKPIIVSVSAAINASAFGSAILTVDGIVACKAALFNSSSQTAGNVCAIVPSESSYVFSSSTSAGSVTIPTWAELR